MLDAIHAEHVYIACGYTDLRSGVDRLAGLVKESFHLDPFSGKMDKLKAEWQELTTKKKAAYKEYRVARSTMQEVLTVKANIDALLGDTRQEKNKEQER